MTFGRGQANRPVTEGLAAEQDASLSLMAARLRGPERVPQRADDLNYAQRQIDHMMRCTKVGCLTCGA